MSSTFRKVKRAFDRDRLATVCAMHEDDFQDAYDMRMTLVDQRPPDDFFLYRDNGSNVLAVAHLDTVAGHGSRACNFLDTAAGPVVYSRALDDRLGAYIILDLLPSLGIQYDWLLTVGEENGSSTAAFFDAPKGKDYDWMIEFDRGGTDVVMYQYEDDATKGAVQDVNAVVGDGIFSDICYLEHLGIKGFNWGVGYRDYHGPRAHAYLDDTYSMVAKFIRFHRENEGAYMPHVQRPSRDSWWSGLSPRGDAIWEDDMLIHPDNDWNENPTQAELRELEDQLERERQQRGYALGFFDHDQSGTSESPYWSERLNA